MISKAIGRGLVLATSTLLLGACATSPYNGYVNAPPGAMRVVENGGYSEEAMAQIAIVQNPDFNGGKISPRALKKIQEYSISCQNQVSAQLAGAGQSTISGAVPYGLAGTGAGLGASLAWGSAASAAKYSTYGGVAYLLPGAVNGLVTGSYAMASAKGSCTRDFWNDISKSKSDPDFEGTHVEPVYAGKSLHSRPPALDYSATIPAPAD